MSIKDLFGRKTVVVKNAESASIDAESNRFVLTKAEENETFVPPVDFATASNFVRFGSAEEYYEASVRRVYGEYPYDGSAAEKILYSLSSSYFDRYILENRYPSTTGYGILNPTGYGAASKTDGYGLNASSDDYEYIWVGGGIRPSPQNQNDPSADDTNIPLYKKFKYGTFYEEGTDKTSVFSFNAASGSTFEFWMKKESFDTTKTEKEVILDLWNGQPSSSAQYGRITIELDATNEGGAGLNPMRLTYQNGTVGVFRQSLASGSFKTSDIADGSWHHWAVSTMPRIDNATTTNYLDLKLYKDGVVLNRQSIVTTSSAGTPQTIGNIVGRLDGYMGALITPVWDGKSGSTTGAKYAGKLSASLDEVRFWKKRINSHEIYNNWYHPIGGGANTDKYREHLALYYKFNEGITTTSSIDSVVLDYSGRVANGSWTGYSVNSRNTGSCFVSASVLAHEPLDPIIRSSHQSVKDLISELQVSGSQYDLNNSAYMYDMVPFWMREEDFEIGDNNLKKIYQILASYFDTLYLQIESLPDLKTKQYFSMEKKPYPFSKQLLQHNGLIVPDLFVNQGVLEKFSQRDDQNKKFEHDMDDLKKRIYYNIYNNLKTIYESKGTEKSYRNMLRCFGIDDEIVKLNLYTDYGVQYLTDKVKYSSQKTKFINHNVTTNFTGRVYNTSSVTNPRTFISSSGPLGSRPEKNLAFTIETDVIIPTKLKVGDLNYFPTDFLTSSIMGFHSASVDKPGDFTWCGTDASNLQVHLVRPINESEDAKFVITNNAKTIFAESQTFKNIYNNERWALGLKVYPVGYPWIGTVATSSNPSYVAELYGVTHNLNDVQREFTITASMTYAQGSAMLANTKRFYAGCEATNFTGSAYHYSDLKIGACRLWYDKLDDAVLKQHNLDASNYGHNKIHGNPTPYVDGLKDVHIPSAEALAFNWDFQQVTASDSNGRFVVEDFSSGTPSDRYGWIDDLILRENRAGGFGYAASSKKVVDNEFIFSAKKELPEISFTSDGVFVKGDEEVYFSEDEDTTDNVFAFEKSMYQIVSEEMLKTFSTVTEYANLFMKPVDLYREEYKRLDHFKELYFERVEGDMDFERFTNYYKFIDAAISIFIQQLHPAMAKFNEGISDMVESHILERPKYKRQFPFMVTRDTIPDGKMAGVKERKYPWREGHAPDYRESFDENDHCFWQKERRTIKPSGSHVKDSINQNLKLNELRQVIVSETDGKAKNLGTTPPYSSYTITFGDGAGGGGVPTAGESLTIAFPSVSLLVSFNSGGANETAFSESTSNELKINIATVTTAAALGAVIRTALINYTGTGIGADVLDLGSIPALTANSSDRILVLTAKTHGHYGLTFSDDAANIIITNISNTPRPTIYQGSTYAVRSFSRQYDFTYEEQKVIHGGTNYGHQKNRDFVLDHLKPHGGVGSSNVPQEVITVGVGEGLGVLGLDKCKKFSDPYITDDYSTKHLEKAEYRFVGTVGRYADGTGDQPKSDAVDQLFKVKGHRAFPFNLVSGTIASGYNKKINDKYDNDFILTNLHSDTTTPSNDIPMQGPFAEAWVGGRQHRHVPMNRYKVKTISYPPRPRKALSWAGNSQGKNYAEGNIGDSLASLGSHDGLTISFWAKPETGGSDERVIAQFDPAPLGGVAYGIVISHVGTQLRIYMATANGNSYRRDYNSYFTNDTWTHTVLGIYTNRPIDGATSLTTPLWLYKNGSGSAVGWNSSAQSAGLSAMAVADKYINGSLGTAATLRLGDLGNPNYDANTGLELQNGELQDFAIYNKRIDTMDWLLGLYNGGKSVWPAIAPKQDRLTNWWLLGDEEELKAVPMSTRLPANQSLKSVVGKKSTITFATHGGTPTTAFCLIEDGLAGSRYTNNNLDDQFSRPEAFRILVGDHPSEPVKDGALGMVGPDYGGPYPDTTRQMAVHYREERAKRPFNIKNIQYGTASAILGNFKENYEVVHSVGRSTNNRKLVEFASVSSSLTSPYGAMLPATTNQASLFGAAPLLSGNVFLAGDSNTSNRTLDKPQVERYEQLGVKASGSMFFRDVSYWYGGSLASGSIHISGSTLYSRATGSFVMSGSHVSGAVSQGHFTLAYPNYTVSEGDFVFTGSFKHGAESSGSITPDAGGAPPALSVSTGQVTVNEATSFGGYAQGSFAVGDIPSLTVSSASFEIADAYIAPTPAQNGAFTVAGRTTYETQYTGSFKLQGPPLAAQRGYANFNVKGTTMTDGHNMTINLGGVSKVIEADTNGSVASSPDITLAQNHPMQALFLDDTKMTDTSVSGWTNGNGIALSLWVKLPSGEIPESGVQELFRLKGGSTSTLQAYWGSSGTKLLVYARFSDGKYISPRWADPIPDDNAWHHVVITFDGVNSDGTSSGSPNFHLYVDNVQKTRESTLENLTGAKAASDLEIVDDISIGDTDIKLNVKDIALWDHYLDSTDVGNLYNSGNYLDHTTHAHASNLVAYYTMSDASDTTTTIQDATANNNDLTVATPSDASFVAAPYTVAKTNTEIYDKLKSDLTTAYSDWKITYRDIGGNEAEFFAHKKLFGASGGTTSISVAGGSTTFVSIANGNGADAVASNLKHGDNITIEGDQFDIFTTTSGSSLPHVNAANTFRKALRFRSIGSDIENHAYNLSYANPTHATKLSVSWRMKLANIDAAVTERIWEFDNGGQNQSWAGIQAAKFIVYLYDDTGDQDHAVAYRTTNFSASDVGVWKHYTLVWSRTNADNETPTLYIDGVARSLSVSVAGDGWANTNPVPVTRVYIGDNDSSGQVQQNAGLQDFAIWNTELTQYDAVRLYNSGSWMNLHSHASASAIWDWWMLGNESNIGQASGSALSTGTAVTSIQPTIGLHALTFNSNSNVIVTSGSADAWKEIGGISAELKVSIAAHTLYQEAANGVSTINFTTSGNTGTFTLTDTLPSAPTAFSNNANQGFHTLSGPTANGLDISVPTGGSVEGHYVDIAGERFYIDSNNSHAGGNYAESGGSYYVYSNAADDATWWARFASAVNAGVTTHTTTHAGSGVFDIDADTPGTAGNITVASNGGSFTSTANATGGTDAANNGTGRGIRFGGATGSLDGSADRDVYVYTDLTTKVAGASGTTTFIQDGVWLNSNGSNRHYYVSSTGSSTGTSGVNTELWQRVTASLAHGLNAAVGAPAATIGAHHSSFRIVDVSGPGARIEFTGSYTLTNGNDFALSSVSAGSSGPQVITITDANVNGFGEPIGGSGGDTYKDDPDFTVNGVNFRFTYPYNSYNAGGNIALRPTGSKAALISHMQSLLEANVPNFNFTTEGDRICMTGSITGSVLNNKITDNAYELVEYVTQTAGGSVEGGVGHGQAIRLNMQGATKWVVSVQTLASASGAFIANGVRYNAGKYYVSSTGSTGSKTNGVDADYWTRLTQSLAHAFLDQTGQTGTWYISGSAASAVLYFTGSFTDSNKHDINFGATSISDGTVGTATGEASWIAQTTIAGYGYPPSAYYTGQGHFMEIDSVTFENVYPYNSYASLASTPAGRCMRHTGSQAFYLAALNATMSANLPNLTNFAVSSPNITFNATVTGSHRNQGLTNLFHNTNTTNMVGGFAHEGVGSNARMQLDFDNAGGARQIYAHDDLRNHANIGSLVYVHDGIWRKSNSVVWHISSTGSAAGSNLTQAEWVRRVHKAFHLIVSGSGLSPVPNYTINIFSGSSGNNYQHQFNITGSLTASNAEEITFANVAGGTTDRMIKVSHDNVDGYGRFQDGAGGHTNVQRLTFANDDTGTETFRFTIPGQSYAKDPSEIGIRATGSVTAYFNRVSSSIKSTLSNYTILNITDMGSDTRKFTIRANNVGSIYNSDVGEDSHLVTAISAMSGGYNEHNRFDDNFVLISHSGSKNHLFILDHDHTHSNNAITNRTHDVTVTVNASNKFALNGELVTGSTYVAATNVNGYGKQQPDLVLVRGSTYRFKQSHVTNYPASADSNHHPIIFHTSPIVSANQGAAVTSSWAAGAETPVRYLNNGSDVTYGAYVTGMDGNADDYVILSASSTTPNRLFYGCGNHGNMGGAIYVVDASSVTYTSTTGSADRSWLNLRDEMRNQFPRLTIAASDAGADDQAATTPTADDYMPLVYKGLVEFTGSTVSGSHDDCLIIASGSSWSDIHQVTGAMTYLEGQMPGQSLNIGWGIHPDTAGRAFHSIGIGGLFSEDPFNASSLTEDRTRQLFTSVYTGSHAIPLDHTNAVNVTSSYYLSSSAMWTSISSSIMNTGQYTITSITNSGNNKYQIFNIASKYRNTRFNHNDYSGSTPSSGDYQSNFLGHGLYTSSVNGETRRTAGTGGFNIINQMLGGVLGHQSVGGNSAYDDSAIEFELGNGETVRIRANFSGWRNRASDPAKTIYWDWWAPTDDAAGRTILRNNLSGAWNSLTASNGVPYYQITSIPANYNNPWGNFYALTASTTGSDFNFVTPADLNPSGFQEQLHRSGSQSMGNDANRITPERHGSHYVTGGVTFLPVLYYSSRINVNQREQALLEDGVRNKTIITSRFYGGGGPEVMTEAFLDVHAKEKSVYSSLPYRNLLVKNDSGEAARFVHETNPYGVTTIYAASASVSVTSHAGRREGLNTLHSRHSGRFGIDSKHGKADVTDYVSPVLRRTFGVKSTVDITYSGAMGNTDKLELAHPDQGVFRIEFVNDATTPDTATTFTQAGSIQRAYVNRESDCTTHVKTAAAVAVLLNTIPGYTAVVNNTGLIVTLTADAIGPHFSISLTAIDSNNSQDIGSVIAGDAGASAFSDTGGGGYEASFHKVHRNTFVRPDVSTALRHPPTTEAVVGLFSADIAESVTYPSSGQMSFSFWVRLDETATTDQYKYVVEADGNADANAFVLRFISNRLQIIMRDTSNQWRRWRTPQFTALRGQWNHFCVVWNKDDITQSPTVYLNASPYATTPTVDSSGTGTGAQRTIAGRIALTGDDLASTTRELQGALQDAAFYNTGLTHAQVNELYDQQDLYSVSFVGNIVEWWPLRSPVPTGVSPIGVEIPKDTKIFPAIGATVFITPPNIRGVPGRGKQPRRDNFYVQNILPQSDYNYSWVETSLGSNYSVRSGKQKVFGYWPKDGILVRKIKKGAKGTYYETQVTASTFDSAISFPTGSDIFGS